MRQNRFFLLIVISLFLVFSLVIYFGGIQIYENEKKWRFENVNAVLLSTGETIKTSFAHSEHDLSFIQGSPGFVDYVDSDLKSAQYRDEVTHFLYVFAKNDKHYRQIGIIDFSGRETVKIENIPTAPFNVPESLLGNEKEKDYFQEAMKLGKDQVYIHETDFNVGQEKAVASNAPVIRLATPLFNSQGEKRGVLFSDLNIASILGLLPKNMLLQTEEGNLLSLKIDGSVEIRKSSYNFKDHEGELGISHVQAIHYLTIELFHDKRFILAVYHDHSSLQEGVHRLIALSVGLLLLSSGLLFAVGFMNFARYRRLIDSHRAIISSLAGLTEWRDPDTGRHLERTRDYAVLLAKQLHNSKKYQRTINKAFIEDLYFAAPLHDMGKVGIRDSILLKEGKFTDEEYEEMKEHAQIGKQLLQGVIDKYKLQQSILIMSQNICAYHHEKYNGKGYSEGLKGEEIPLEARIFALCDAYDAIRSKRPYKAEIGHEEAVNRVVSDRGEHFDPNVVDSFLRCADEFEKLSNQNR